jgi:hypothetical protein
MSNKQTESHRAFEPITPEQITALVERIKPLLVCHPLPLQAAALTELVAIWLAAHHVDGDEDATREMRVAFLADHCFAVRQLVLEYDRYA